MKFAVWMTLALFVFAPLIFVSVFFFFAMLFAGLWDPNTSLAMKCAMLAAPVLFFGVMLALKKTTELLS